jgi:hypothetical protein
MMAADVTPMLDLARHGEVVRIEARVSAEHPRPLRWTLTVKATSAGGVSNVAQAGTTSGASPAPVGSVQVNAGARGSAELVVEEDGRAVARTRVQLPP